MTVFHMYITLMIFLHSVEEIWNCSNPRKFPKKNYIVCDWNENDIYKDNNGKYHPYPKAQEDNYFERRARIKYWQKKRQDKK